MGSKGEALVPFMRKSRILRRAKLCLMAGSCMMALALGVFAQQSSTASGKTPSAAKPASSSSPRMPTLLIQADLDCMFGLDDQPSQTLKAGEIRRISMDLGEHLVTAVSADGKDHWKTVVDVDKPLQKVVLIELVKVRAARQVAERQVAQLQQEIAAKEQKAKEISAATQALGEQQEEVKKQRQEIEDQIDALSKQARQEEEAAQAAEASARQGQVMAGTAAAQGTKLGNFAATLNGLASSSSVDSAAKHRAKARELQDQIVDLNRKLERLGTEDQSSLTPGASAGSRTVLGPGGGAPPGSGVAAKLNEAKTLCRFYYDNGEYGRAFAQCQNGLNLSPTDVDLSELMRKVKNAKANDISAGH